MLLPHHFFFKGESIATFRTKKWGLSPASFFLIFDSSHIRCVLLRKGQTTPALWNILKSLKKHRRVGNNQIQSYVKGFINWVAFNSLHLISSPDNVEPTAALISLRSFNVDFGTLPLSYSLRFQGFEDLLVDITFSACNIWVTTCMPVFCMVFLSFLQVSIVKWACRNATINFWHLGT